MGSVVFDYKGLNLTLLPEKAVWIDSMGVLLIADLHFGKAAHFRKSGIPISEKVHDQDYQMMTSLVLKYSPNQVYFLGDLFHSSWNEEWENLLSFLGLFPTTSFHLVVGNHDILPSEKYKDSRLMVHTHPITLGALLLSHEPTLPPSGFLNVCGHIHPGILLKGKAKQRISIPCFHYSENVLVLPSFGNFTGLALIKKQKNDGIWGIAEDRLIPILSPPVIG
jgi:DNA ligase-associated metallophosphoesterase